MKLIKITAVLACFDADSPTKGEVVEAITEAVLDNQELAAEILMITEVSEEVIPELTDPTPEDLAAHPPVDPFWDWQDKAERIMNKRGYEAVPEWDEGEENKA